MDEVGDAIRYCTVHAVTEAKDKEGYDISSRGAQWKVLSQHRGFRKAGLTTTYLRRYSAFTNTNKGVSPAGAELDFRRATERAAELQSSSWPWGLDVKITCLSLRTVHTAREYGRGCRGMCRVPCFFSQINFLNLHSCLPTHLPIYLSTYLPYITFPSIVYTSGPRKDGLCSRISLGTLTSDFSLLTSHFPSHLLTCTPLHRYVYTHLRLSILHFVVNTSSYFTPPRHPSRSLPTTHCSRQAFVRHPHVLGLEYLHYSQHPSRPKDRKPKANS